MLQKLDLAPSEKNILKKILIQNGISKKMIKEMPVHEMLEAVIFFVVNKEIIKKLKVGSHKCRIEICSCMLDNRTKK